MDIIRTCCLHCGKQPEANDSENTVIAAHDSEGNTLAHTALTPHRDGFMITDEHNYRPVFHKCVCSVVCGRTLIERYWRKPVTLTADL